jgi:hypothetical protein
MSISIINATGVLRRSGCCAALSLALAGCSPQGAGTMDVSKPDEIQAKVAGGEAAAKPQTEKQAKAVQIEQEAAKKNPKLR